MKKNEKKTKNQKSNQKKNLGCQFRKEQLTSK